MITVMDGGRELQIGVGYWTGREKVFFNKKCVSSKWSVGGAHHLFEIESEGSLQKYEVEIGLRWHWFGKYLVVRRNGEIIFTNK